MNTLSIGVDTGGTFTDLVLLDRAAGSLAIHKLPTTPDDPAQGILQGIEALLAAAKRDAGDIDLLVHGTTLATNAILQRRHAKTGMLTTAGFRDVLEIGRQRRPSFYNLDVSKPVPPVTRDCIFEIAGRLDETGAEVAPLDEAAVRAAVEALRGAGIEAITVCFMHAYAGIVTLTAWLRHGRCFSVSGCARYPTVVTAFHRSSSSMPSGSIAVSR